MIRSCLFVAILAIVSPAFAQRGGDAYRSLSPEWRERFTAAWSAEVARARTRVANTAKDLRSAKTRDAGLQARGDQASAKKYLAELLVNDPPFVPRLNPTRLASGDFGVPIVSHKSAGEIPVDATVIEVIDANHAVVTMTFGPQRSRRAVTNPADPPLGGGAEKGSAAAYSAIARAMNQSMSGGSVLMLEGPTQGRADGQSLGPWKTLTGPRGFVELFAGDTYATRSGPRWLLKAEILSLDKPPVRPAESPRAPSL